MRLHHLLWFEVKGQMKKPSSWVFFVIFLCLSFLLGISVGGAFKSISMSLGFSKKLFLNSPVMLYFLTSSVGCWALFVTAPIFGWSIVKDYDSGFSQVLFSTPMRKPTYFFTRFFGSLISSLIIFSSIPIGLFLATKMPFVDQTSIQQNHLSYYLVPFLTNVLPNILVYGAIFTAVAASSRKMASVYIAGITIYCGYMIAGVLTGDLESKFLGALIEPFGVKSAKELIQYWSVLERNTRLIPFTGVLLYNRAIWCGMGLFTLLGAYLSFIPIKLSREKKKPLKNIGSLKDQCSIEVELLPQSWKVFWLLALSEFKQIFKNIYFLVLLFIGVLYFSLVGSFAGKIYGTPTLPVTYHVLEIITAGFYLFGAIITSFYAGELIWKDRTWKMYELVDSKPVSNFFLYSSKLLSLFFLQSLLLGVVFIISVLIQTMRGYYNYEWSLYFKYLSFFFFPMLLLNSVLAFFTHTIAKNRAMGHALFVFSYLFVIGLSSFGFNHRLYVLGSLPKMLYSDMNAFGSAIYPFFIFALYWGSFYLLLAVVSILVWQRGTTESWIARMKEFKARMNPRYKQIMGMSLFSFGLIGSFIFYNTNVLNEYKTSFEKETKLAQYELKYSHFEKLPHPELVAVNVHVDLFPETESMEAKGAFMYKNKTEKPIERILVLLERDSEPAELVWSREGELAEFDKDLGVRIYTFEKPILPNEELQLDFKLAVSSKGFKNSEPSTKIVHNGTFFHSDYFPVMGYLSQVELKSEKQRKNFGLREKRHTALIDDVEALSKTYISHEGNWIDFEATLSTSLDQIAIAPGYLESEWQVGNRRYFHYKMDQPILPLYGFLSGRYEVARDEFDGVKIEIYHHPDHDTNTQRMIKSIKCSLDYYTKNFSPYQFDQLRIIEFPRYRMFAQSLPNTIPFSEGIGFIADVKEGPLEIDFPFYVTAHEVAHQWWAHQVIGADVQGSTMLSESLAQYSALMVMEKEYGPNQIRKFLKYELDKYLSGRALESSKEQPLMLCENQNYIHYNKGSLVFYALKDYLGEEVVNQVLRDYIHDVAFQSPPFTTSKDLVARFKKAAPEDLKYLITDLFETITFYDNQTKSAVYQELADGKFEVEIVSLNKKFRAAGLGEETETVFEDLVDVGVFDYDGKIQYLKKHKIKSGENTIRLVVDKLPSKAGIDPLHKLIDKDPAKNCLKIALKEDKDL